MKYFHLTQLRQYAGLTVAISDMEQEQNTPPHQHDYIEIVYVYAGHGMHLVHDPSDLEKTRSNTVIKGDIFTILPGEVHSYQDTYRFRIYNLCVDPDFLHDLAPELDQLEYFKAFFDPDRSLPIHQLHLTPIEFMKVEEIIREIALVLHLNPDRKSRRLVIRSLLLELMILTFDGIHKHWKQYPARIDRKFFLSIEKLEAFPARKWDLKEISREVGMSLSSYAHKFKEIVGISPAEYVIMLRLEQVRMKLEKTSRSLYEIAGETGFSDDNYLIRLFRKRYGITPHKYRSLYRNPGE